MKSQRNKAALKMLLKDFIGILLTFIFRKIDKRENPQIGEVLSAPRIEESLKDPRQPTERAWGEYITSKRLPALNDWHPFIY